MGAVEFWFWVFVLPIAATIKFVEWILKMVFGIEDKPKSDIDWARPDGPHDLGL